ncbi:MAG: TIGR04211 family SH3 domain-containing protein [Gammaproteobacteria bacterium]|nr:TIGR04211 family SH3 domain-containing protein [Gammaproteobacteria bacterium]
MDEIRFRFVVVLLAWLATAVTSSTILAESLFITDRFSIDVYSEKSAQGELIKSLPSGAIVEVLSRDQAYAKIRTQDNIEGWLESKYLTMEKPTQIAYLQLAAKYKAAQDKIQDYETRLLEMQELRKEAQTVDWLRNKLKENETTENTLGQNLKLKDITIAELKITVANLEEQLANARRQLDEILQGKQPENGQSQLPESATTPPLYSTSSSVSFYTWLVLSLAVTLIIGILMGFVLIDYKVRKKQSADLGLY